MGNIDNNYRVTLLRRNMQWCFSFAVAFVYYKGSLFGVQQLLNGVVAAIPSSKMLANVMKLPNNSKRLLFLVVISMIVIDLLIKSTNSIILPMPIRCCYFSN